MSSTQEWRKCYICGEPVLWQTCGIGWHPIQYHDCKPVPLARLQQAERERDEARVMVVHNLEAAQHAEARLEQAVALLREARDRIGYDKDGVLRSAIGAFIAGQPAPVKVVDYAMVERAREVLHDRGYMAVRQVVRSALVAALEGRE